MLSHNFCTVFTQPDACRTVKKKQVLQFHTVRSRRASIANFRGLRFTGNNGCNI